ncbi:restriction endonuclease [Agrobacterium sp. InxBP2]|uniref:restriction endonuclease n=1 Tax=Agrobacterium sp. InxBP2 TaxID=2870329 RepID=UPI00249E0CAF|nr:restriction endonuclease [Agrobacterium sp. InxBP2]MCW8283567.1 restriction endonuclease [Agrobacterium sp. InxBP2]
MVKDVTIWGVHMGVHVEDRPIQGGYVAIGWPALGDVRQVGQTREDYKRAMAKAYVDIKPGAIPVDAGTVFKFVHEIQAGDFVIYPSKSDRMINIGRFLGQSAYDVNDSDDYPNRQLVKWLGHFPRNEFSQSALNEVGSFLTLFRIKRHAAEFLSKIGLGEGDVHVAGVGPVAEVQEEVEDDDSATVAVSRQAEETTEDFVVRRIMAQLSGYQFEELVAHLMECMGYTARLTPKSADGGVDVIAHMDALGFQPPIIKIQCKRTTAQHGSPEVNQLLGTLGEGEFGLFVSLGSFSRSANELERNRSKLRLIDGEAFVAMILENYGKLSPRYRAIVPLKQIYVPDLPSP